MSREPDPTCIVANFKPNAPDPQRPVPMVFRRAEDGEQPTCFADPVTGYVRVDSAEIAAMIYERTPEGRELADQERNRLSHERLALSEAKSLLKAQPISAADWDECVFTEERIYADLADWRRHEIDAFWPSDDDRLDSEILAEIEPQLPGWIWATKTELWAPNPERIIDFIQEDANDNAFDDAADQIDFGPLREFLKEWAPKQSMSVYWEDRTRVIVLDQSRYEAGVAAARELAGSTP